MSLIEHFRFSTHERIEALPTVRIRSLLGGRLLDQPDDTRALDEYDRLGDTALSIFRTSRVPDGSVSYIGVAKQMAGMELNALTHFAAPNKQYGLDTRDYLNDARSLFNPKTDTAHERLKSHRMIPNWDRYESIKDQYTEAIRADFEGSDDPPRLVPVVNIYRMGTFLKYNFHLSENVACHLTSSDFHTPILQRDQLRPELGPLLLAAFSPDISKTWNKKDSYTPDCPRTQVMAATQALPYTLAHCDDLLHGTFARNLIRYAELGMLPDDNAVDTGMPPLPSGNTSINNDIVW